MSPEEDDDEMVWERCLRRKHWTTVRDAVADDGRIEFQCGAGWAALIDDVFTIAGEALAGTGQQLRVLQIKQKLGGLRIAVDDLPPDAMTAVSRAMQEAEFLSFATCETCGGPGRLMIDRLGWWATPLRWKSTSFVQGANCKGCSICSRMRLRRCW
jgi:hypothetical protein